MTQKMYLVTHKKLKLVGKAPLWDRVSYRLDGLFSCMENSGLTSNFYSPEEINAHEILTTIDKKATFFVDYQAARCEELNRSRAHANNDIASTLYYEKVPVLFEVLIDKHPESGECYIANVNFWEFFCQHPKNHRVHHALDVFVIDINKKIFEHKNNDLLNLQIKLDIPNLDVKHCGDSETREVMLKIREADKNALEPSSRYFI